MDKKALEAKRDEATQTFDKLEAQKTDLNKQVNGINTEQTRVQGDYRTLTALIDNFEEKSNATSTRPKSV